MNCIYCTNEIENASLEHIIPEALGGSQVGDLFKTRDVCEYCNNLLGLFADGLYIKSYFSQANRALSAGIVKEDVNLMALPFHYIGYVKFEDNLGYKDCEMWLSQCGGRVFHFHNNRDESYFAYAGGNPIDKKKKSSGGLAIFLNGTDSEDMLIIGLKSFVKYFKFAERVVSYVDFKLGFPDGLGRSPNAKEVGWINWYQENVVKDLNNVHKCSFSMELGYPDRMMAKIAIGVGFNLFGDDFLSSEYCEKLRDYMWEKDYKKRAESNVVRHGSFDLKDNIFPPLVSLGRNVTVFITSNELGVIILLDIYGDEQSILITHDQILTEKFQQQYPDGIVYVTSLLCDKYEGPMGMMEFLASDHMRANGSLPFSLLYPCPLNN